MECIICKNTVSQEELDNEHVVPESIGGNFVLKNAICKNCNHRLGTKVDSFLVDNFVIKLERNHYKIPNKERIVPNLFGLGTLNGESQKKVLWNSDKEGNPTNLHLYPYVYCEEQNDGSIIIEVDADESYGEEAILKMVKLKLNRMGKKVSLNELDEKLTPSKEYRSSQPKINYHNKIDLIEYKAAMVKMAYEMSYYWLGDKFLTDDIAQNLRQFLFDIAYKKETVLESLSKYNIMGTAEFFQGKPFYEIPGHEKCHYIILINMLYKIVCYIKIFNVIHAIIPISFEPNSYPDLKDRYLILNYKTSSHFEPPNFNLYWPSINLESFDMKKNESDK